MAYDPPSHRRRSISDHGPSDEDGNEGNGGNGRHSQGSHTTLQSARYKAVHNVSQAKAVDRDTPTLPIDVPLSYHGAAQIHPHDRHADSEQGNMDSGIEHDEEVSRDGDNRRELHDATIAGIDIPERLRSDRHPPRLRLRTRAASRSILDQIALERAGGHAATGSSRTERPTGPQSASLASTVPEEAVDAVPSLSESVKGSSPPYEDLPTPAQEVYGSPLAASPWQSPASASSSWYSRKYGMARQSSSLRRTRRSGATPVSQSPAAEFLRKYSASSTPRSPPGDSEGVEIGEYVLGREIGSGGFSTVREAFSSTSPSATPTLAVKIVRKQIRGHSESENETLQAQFDHEIEIWKPLQHQHILRMHDTMSTKFATFAFMPLVTGGSLWDAVKDSKGQGLEVNLVRKYAAQLAQALRYLHQDMRLVHRDVKLENCLLELGTSHGNYSSPRLLLADFGLAEYLPANSMSEMRIVSESPPISPENERKLHVGSQVDQEGPAGSLPYAAPELLSTKKIPPLNTKIDIWAYGVLVYALIAGRMPFQHSFTPKLVEMIKGGEFDRELLRSRMNATASPSSTQSVDMRNDALSGSHSLFRNESWARSVSMIVPTDGISPDGDDAMEIVEGCLTTKPSERWNVSRLMDATWLRDELVDDDNDDGLEMNAR